MFVVGLTAAAVGLVVGEALAPAVDRVGLAAWMGHAGVAGKAALGWFIASFPVAAMVMMAGSALASRPGAGRRVGLTTVTLTTAGIGAVLLLVPALLRARYVPLYFGVGGCLVLALFVAVVWLWGGRRAALDGDRRRAADVTMAGYAVLACAAWQTCGLGGMPSYALFPERMIELGSRPIAVVILQQVMALLVLGWALTALGQWLAGRAAAGEGK